MRFPTAPTIAAVGPAMFSKLRNLVTTKSRIARIGLLAVAVPVAIVLLVLLVYGVDRFLHRDEVLRNVSVADRDLSGRDEEGVRRVVAEIEAELAVSPGLFTVNDREFAIDPARIGFSIDADAVVEDAMDRGRQGGPWAQLRSWFRQFTTEEEVALPTSIEDEALQTIFDQWEETAITVRVFDGAVEVEDGRAVPVYPTKGLAIERTEASAAVLETLSGSDRPVTEIPLTVLEPRLDDADIDAAVEEANLLISDSVVLTQVASSQLRAEFTGRQLANALRSDVVDGPPVRLVFSFDPETVDAFLSAVRNRLELPPSDAEFRINADDTVTLIPAQIGTLLDAEMVAEALLEAAATPSRRGVLPIVEGAEPEFTTEEAEAMMPITKVSEFTTNHACCQPRVENIQLMADILDGTTVWPGETLSLNETAGRRTAEGGFKPAPMIREGELEDEIGGGVSQFATTFYNAVFYGGYEDVEHTPHSIYISRYPECNEATISWPQPDLKFRNNTDAVVIIKTDYTDTSITVKFFGNNGGLTVERTLGARSNFAAPVTKHEANAEVIPGTERVLSNGSQGWSVSCSRIITYPDGSQEEESWTHRYRGEVRKVQLHPCEMPGASVECPVQVPSLIGLSLDAAGAAAAGVGLTVVSGGPVEVSLESGLGGLVAEQSPGADALVPMGTAIQVLIGVAPAPPSTTVPPTTAPPQPTTTAPPQTTTTPPTSTP